MIGDIGKICVTVATRDEPQPPVLNAPVTESQARLASDLIRVGARNDLPVARRCADHVSGVDVTDPRLVPYALYDPRHPQNVHAIFTSTLQANGVFVA